LQNITGNVQPFSAPGNFWVGEGKHLIMPFSWS